MQANGQRWDRTRSLNALLFSCLCPVLADHSSDLGCCVAVGTVARSHRASPLLSRSSLFSSRASCLISALLMEFHYLQFWLAFVILSGVLCLAAFAFLLARTGEDSVSGMIAQRFQSSAYIMIVALTTFCVACSALITMCGMTQIDATADPNAGHNHTFFFLAAVSPLLVLFILVFPLVVYRSDRALGFQPLDRTHTDKPMMAAYARLVIGSGVSTIDDREALNHALIWDRRKDPINIAHNGNDGGGDAEAPQQQAATRHEIGLPALSQAPAQQPPPVPTIIATTPSPLGQ